MEWRTYLSALFVRSKLFKLGMDIKAAFPRNVAILLGGSSDLSNNMSKKKLSIADYRSGLSVEEIYLRELVPDSSCLQFSISIPTIY